MKRAKAFLHFGFGVKVYFDLLYLLFWLFLLLSIILSPLLTIYSSHGQFQNPFMYEAYSLGNMGSSSAQCLNIPLEVALFPMSCPYGTIGHIKDFGVSPENSEKMTSCLNNEYTKVC